jgi:hypothetical protein
VHITDVLEVLGVLCLVAFAFLIWPPAAIAVGGVALIAASFFITRRGRA